MSPMAAEFLGQQGVGEAKGGLEGWLHTERTLNKTPG